MREIQFKAKRKDNGEWVEGWLFDDGMVEVERYFIGSIVVIPYMGTACDDWVISGHCFYEVDPETVCQYTGLTDKNGVKIWEGDIIKTHYANAKKCDFIEKVIFFNGRFCSLFLSKDTGKMISGIADGVRHLIQDKSIYMEWCEVIGNCFDNPDLLKGDA